MAKKTMNKYAKQNKTIQPLVWVMLALTILLIIIAIILNQTSEQYKIYDDYSKGLEGASPTLVRDNSITRISNDNAINMAKGNGTVIILLGGRWNVSTVNDIGVIDAQFRKPISQEPNKEGSDQRKMSDFTQYIHLVELENDEDIITSVFEQWVEVFPELGELRSSTGLLTFKDVPQLMAFHNGEFIATRAEFINSSPIQNQIRMFYQAVVDKITQ